MWMISTRRLVHAIINGDAKEAEHCMSEHMQTIEKYMLEMAKRADKNRPFCSE